MKQIKAIVVDESIIELFEDAKKGDVINLCDLMVSEHLIDKEFLNRRYQDLILKNELKMIQLKTQEEILAEFNKLKNIYLDIPLKKLKDKTDVISYQVEKIRKSTRTIKDACDKIIDDYIENVSKKINDFEIRVKNLSK